MRRLFLAAAAVVALSCNDDVTGLGPPSDPTTETFAPSLGVNIATMQKTESGVWYTDLVVGTGPADTANTDSVRMTYAAYLKDGTKFDEGTNVRFVPANLIVGVRTGILGVREGGRRKLVIPSALAYGAQAIRDTNGAIKVPRQATLVFDVELLKVFNPVHTTKTSTSLRQP